jgi:PST family polysaccharide transporter
VSELGVVADTVPPPADARPKRKSRKNYGKTAKVGAMWAVGRESVTQVLALPTAVLLARLLSPADFGIVAASSFFIQLGKRLGNMGLNTALVRMKDVREEHRASVFVLNMVIGLSCWALLMVAAPYLGAYYGDTRVTGALRLSSMIFLVNFFGVVEYAILQREMRFKQMALVEWTIPLLLMPTSVALAWAGYGYWSLLIGHLVSNAGSTAMKVYLGGWRPSFRVTRRGLAETVPFGMGVYAKRLLTYAAENLDSLIVGGMFGVTSLGFYDKAYNAADNLSNRLSLGSTVMFRIFAIIREERERFIRAYTKVVLTGTIATLPVFAGLIIAAREFIVVLFGPKWLPAAVPFQLLCAAASMRLISGYASSAVQASGQIWGEVARKVTQVVLIVSLIIVFKPWGIQGAAFAVLAASVTLAILMQGLVRQVIGLTWRELLAPLWPSLVATVLTSVVIGSVTLAVRHYASGVDAWVVLILQAASGGVSWITFTLYARVAALQDVVDEVLDDLVPQPIRRVVDRIRPRHTRPVRA